MALLITAAWNGYELKIEILIAFKAKAFFFSRDHTAPFSVCLSGLERFAAHCKTNCMYLHFCHCGYVTINEVNGLVGELIICQSVNLPNESQFRESPVFPCTAFFLVHEHF